MCGGDFSEMVVDKFIRVTMRPEVSYKICGDITLFKAT